MSNLASVKNVTNHLEKENIKIKLSKVTEWLKKAVKRQLDNLTHGQLRLIDGEEVTTFVGSVNSEISAEIEILNEEFYWFVAFGGGVGAGEAYISHFWRSPELTQVIRLFAVNQSVMDSMEGRLAKFTTPMKKSFHWLNKNTQKGSKKNIVAHYDLGNDFFKLFLDPTMMYSSGIFYESKETMEQASLNKLERVCARLKLKSTDHVLEIGTGWGGFAIYAAKNYDCQVTTTTISDEQYEYALEKITAEGLERKITLLKKDYRDLQGQFDKLVSIEMIEAVGHHYYDTFFAKCNALLKSNGEMLIQAITITDQRFEQAKKDIDFIKRYIFPGSCIPSINSISTSLTRSSDLRITHMDDIGTHYATTLKHWRIKFFQELKKIKEQGFNNRFIRMWEYYFCYCEGGFKEQVISTSQLHLVKPMARVSMSMKALEK